MEKMELFYRLVNARDVTSQDGVVLNPQQMISYKYPPLDSVPSFQVPDFTLHQNTYLTSTRQRTRAKSRHHVKNDPSKIETQILPPSRLSKVETPNHLPERSELVEDTLQDKTPSRAQSQVPSLPSVHHITIQTMLGIQIDKILDLDVDFAQVKITLCDKDRQALYAQDEPAVYKSHFVNTPFLERVHLFQLDQVVFNPVEISVDSVLLLEIFERTNVDDGSLIAWSAVPLYNIKLPSRASRMSRQSKSTLQSQVISGIIQMNLYKPPVTLHESFLDKTFTSPDTLDSTGGVAVLFLFNHHIQPLMEPLPIPRDGDGHIPEGAWIEHSVTPNTALYANGDGFEIYVDSGRFFPDSCVASKIVLILDDGTVNTKRGQKNTFETLMRLDVNALEPIYDARFECREYSYLPSIRLIFKVFILDGITKQVSLLGIGLLPLFLDPNNRGTTSSASEVCLNTGAFQLRLEQVGFNPTPNESRSFIPCASLLVRILPAACHPDGQPKMSSEYPEDEWITEGILVPPPDYKEGVYDSLDCQPSFSEAQVLQALVKRKPLLQKDAVLQIIQDQKKINNDQKILEWLKNQFKLSGNLPLFDQKFLAKYNTHHGVAFSLDAAQNVNWSGLLFATYCFSPPASFLKGTDSDQVWYVHQLDPNCDQKHPIWKDGIKVHPRRMYHDNLAIIIQVYETLPDMQTTDGYVIKQQAWTLIPVCVSSYPHHGLYQIPLFQGYPSLQIVNDIQTLPLGPAIASMRKKKQLKVVDGMSLFVRIGDPRRLHDLEQERIPVNTNYLPRTNKFNQRQTSRPLKSLLPKGVSADDYVRDVGKAFKEITEEDLRKRSKTNPNR